MGRTELSDDKIEIYIEYIKHALERDDISYKHYKIGSLVYFIKRSIFPNDPYFGFFMADNSDYIINTAGETVKGRKKIPFIQTDMAKILYGN